MGSPEGGDTGDARPVHRNIRIDVPGHKAYELNDYTPESDPSSGFPIEDIGVIVLCHRPGHKRRDPRTVLCAGMTTYGTAAAAEFLFDRLARMSRQRARKRCGVRMFSRHHDMIIVVEAEVSGGEVIDAHPVANFRIKPRKGATGQGTRPEQGHARELQRA